MLTLVTTTNTQIHANYVHLTSPQQCVNIPTSLSQNSGPMTPGNKFQNILTLASIAISLCVRSIGLRTSSISYSLTYATTALHSALPHNHV